MRSITSVISCFLCSGMEYEKGYEASPAANIHRRASWPFSTYMDRSRRQLEPSPNFSSKSVLRRLSARVKSCEHLWLGLWLGLFFQLRQTNTIHWAQSLVLSFIGILLLNILLYLLSSFFHILLNQFSSFPTLPHPSSSAPCGIFVGRQEYC